MLKYDECGEIAGTIGTLELQSLMYKYPLCNCVVVNWQFGHDLMSQTCFADNEQWLMNENLLVKQIFTPLSNWYYQSDSGKWSLARK